MCQQLHDIGIKFDVPVLDDYFRPIRSKCQAKDWIRGPVFRARGYEHFIGKVVPSPGRIIDLSGDAPAVEIHATVRLREYGRTPSDPAVPGYGYDAITRRWVRNEECVSRPDSPLASTWPIMRPKISTTGSDRQASWPGTASFLDEAALGALEARLLDLSV